MKKLSTIVTIVALILFGANAVVAQEDAKKEEGYIFTHKKEIPYTPVKDQNRSGTCWSFSGIGFLECELLRMGKGEYDLADMWIVNKAYGDKADVYVRMHGNYNFGGGGSFFDVLKMIQKYGIMPEEVYKGADYGEELPVHGELDALLKSYVDVVVTNPNKKLSTGWKKGFQAVVDAYLGSAPENFTYKGVTYTPQSFANSLGINMDDYISITSFAHHPFYTKFALEIPDNWIMEQSYNLPLDEFMAVMNNAVDNGYSIAWGSDVSTKGFN
ncbi:MAG: aminopeptidase, partial [Bacteroidales bacterium]